MSVTPPNMRSWIKQNWIYIFYVWLAIGILIYVLGFVAEVSAHRSGCHSWHSCESDRGTYTCGDTGRCTYCADNYYCKDGVYKPGWQPKQTESSSVDIAQQIKESVLAEEQEYRKTPHWFREKLIDGLFTKFNITNKSYCALLKDDCFWVSFYVYTLLPDIK